MPQHYKQAMSMGQLKLCRFLNLLSLCITFCFETQSAATLKDTVVQLDKLESMLLPLVTNTNEQQYHKNMPITLMLEAFDDTIKNVDTGFYQTVLIAFAKRTHSHKNLIDDIINDFLISYHAPQTALNHAVLKVVFLKEIAKALPVDARETVACKAAETIEKRFKQVAATILDELKKKQGALTLKKSSKKKWLLLALLLITFWVSYKAYKHFNKPEQQQEKHPEPIKMPVNIPVNASVQASMDTPVTAPVDTPVNAPVGVTAAEFQQQQDAIALLAQQLQKNQEAIKNKTDMLEADIKKTNTTTQEIKNNHEEIHNKMRLMGEYQVNSMNALCDLHTYESRLPTPHNATVSQPEPMPAPTSIPTSMSAPEQSVGNVPEPTMHQASDDRFERFIREVGEIFGSRNDTSFSGNGREAISIGSRLISGAATSNH